ncbi:TIGR04222 domain-containing membrane protein [Streptomyces sp. NPDC059070]|uniref:TIGR04222 domain-containing membrane protein n=1 Tax=unclassified Streptomyces TaxID=2593676 RepID=UPI0034E2ACD5
MWWFIGAAGVQLIVAAALLRPPPARRHALDPVAAACVRGGPRAALTVALVGLHLSGAVEAGAPGTVRLRETPDRPPCPLQRAAALSLQRPLGVRPLLARPRVRQAVDNLVDGLAADGVLRRPRRWKAAQPLLAGVPLTLVVGVPVSPPTAPQLVPVAALLLAATALFCLPRRTRAGHRLLAGLRAAHPLPMTRPRPPDDEILLLTAVHGDRALTMLLPRFAAAAGLLARGGAGTAGPPHLATAPLLAPAPLPSTPPPRPAAPLPPAARVDPAAPVAPLPPAAPTGRGLGVAGGLTRNPAGSTAKSAAGAAARPAAKSTAGAGPRGATPRTPPAAPPSAPCR